MVPNCHALWVFFVWSVNVLVVDTACTTSQSNYTILFNARDGYEDGTSVSTSSNNGNYLGYNNNKTHCTDLEFPLDVPARSAITSATIYFTSNKC